MRYILLLTLIVFASSVGAVSLIYQETANASELVGSWTDGANTYDGDWSTFGARSSGDAQLYENYSKIVGAINWGTSWESKDGSTSQNESIPAGCWAQEPLQVKLNSTPIGDPPSCNVIYSCWDGAAWSDVFTNGDGCPNGFNLYEDALWWNTQEECRQMATDTVLQTDVEAHEADNFGTCFDSLNPITLNDTNLDCAGHMINGTSVYAGLGIGYVGNGGGINNNCTFNMNITGTSPSNAIIGIMSSAGYETAPVVVNNTRVICNGAEKGIWIDGNGVGGDLSANMTNITIQNTVIENCPIGLDMSSPNVFNLINVTYINNYYDSCELGVCAKGSAYPTSCSPDGVCLRYDGSGNSTHLYDVSGNGNDGLIQGTVPLHAGYFDLNGVTGTVLTPNLTIIGTDWTIQTWVKFNNLTCDVGSPQNFITAYQSQQQVISPSEFGTLQAYCDGLSYDGWDGWIETWDTLGGPGTPYTVSLFNTTELVGKWALVTLTSNATAKYMHFNNRSFYQPYQQGGAESNVFSNIPITIGNSTIPLSEVLIPYYDAFNGSLGNFTIYNYTKNESQIAADFAAGDPFYNPTPTPTSPPTPVESNYATARFIVGNSLAVFTLFSSWQGLIVLAVAGGAILLIMRNVFGTIDTNTN